MRSFFRRLFQSSKPQVATPHNSNRFRPSLHDLEGRDVPSAYMPAPYLDLVTVSPLGGDFASVNGNVSPGLAVDVIDDGAPEGFDLYVNINAVHGFSLVAKVEGSPYAIELGSTFIIDGIDQIAITYLARTQAQGGVHGSVNINDNVLLPFAPSYLVGAGPNDPVNQPPGPYGNGNGPF